MIELDKDEHIFQKVRKHWFHFFIRDIVLFIVTLLVPLLIILTISILPWPTMFTSTGNVTALLLFIITSWALISWVMLFIAWTDYYLDLLVITNKRVFDIEQFGLFSRTSSTFRLDRIQDVTVEVKGFIPTILNFGHIRIQTAGDNREFVAYYIPRPYEVRQLIIREHDRAVELMSNIQL